MSDPFEEARHHGYSAADLAADMKELEERCEALGCDSCSYRDGNYAICVRVIEDEKLYKYCPYKKEAR